MVLKESQSVPGLEFLGMGSKFDHIFKLLFFRFYS